MAGKKGAAIQLQQEINTDEEWEEMVKKPGLTVVDIYSGWCGPCVGMVGNLKKVKLEIGGDLLHLAIAKADTITCLSRFRNKSEPTWMFISNGKMVNLMFGANAPRLIKLMTEEIQKEGDFQKGLIERHGIAFDELTPEEQVRVELEKAKEEERNAVREAALNEEREKRRQKVIKRLVRELKYDSIILFLPFLYDEESSSWPAYSMLIDILGSNFSMKKTICVDLSLEDAEKFFGVYEEDIAEELERVVKQGPCLARIIGLPNPEPTEDAPEAEEEEPEPEEPPLEEAEPEEEEQEQIHATEAIYYAIYGSGGLPDLEVLRQEEEAAEEEGFDIDEEEGELSLLTKLFHQFAEITSIPAIWAPATEEQKAEAVMILFPAYVEELMGPEPPPLPPHVAVIFDAHKYPQLTETIQEFEGDVIHSGFFDGANPNTARKVAASYNEYLLSRKTGKEKFILMLNNSKSDPVLAFSQLAPVYVSLNQDDGKEDCEKLFPEDEEQQEVEMMMMEGLEPSLASEISLPTYQPPSPTDSMESYDPLAMRAEAAGPDITMDDISIASGFGDITGEAEAPAVETPAPEGQTAAPADAAEAPAAENAPAADAAEEEEQEEEVIAPAEAAGG